MGRRLDAPQNPGESPTAAPVPQAAARWAVWRPVLTLGITQIVGFGTLYYAFGVMVLPLSADLGITPTFAYGVLSAALLVGSLGATLAGRMIDRHGARVMMAAGSAACGMAFVAMAQIGTAWGLIATLTLAELIAPLVLYDAAFAAIAQAVGERRARRAITQMTLLGGFASTVFWPLTLALVETWDWRVALWVFAGLHVLICLPLHLSLPRPQRAQTTPSTEPPQFAPLPPASHPRAMAFLAVGLSLSWAVMAAFSAQWVPVMAAIGLEQTVAVAAGALMGPAQVIARVVEMTVAGRRHPMETALVAMLCLAAAVAVLALAPVGAVTASVFAVLFGIGQGLATMVRGTVPLVLFGLMGYATRLGRLAALRMVVAALAPFGMAGSMATLGPAATLWIACGLSLASLVALWAVPWRVRG